MNDAAHYGRHDPKYLGANAVRQAVPSVISDDRIPSGMWVCNDSALGEMLGGRHRLDQDRPRAVRYSSFFYPGDFVRPDAEGNLCDPISGGGG